MNLRQQFKRIVERPPEQESKPVDDAAYNLALDVVAPVNPSIDVLIDWYDLIEPNVKAMIDDGVKLYGNRFKDDAIKRVRKLTEKEL